MKRRMSQKDFSKFYKVIWQSGPQVRYQNPDAWLTSYVRGMPF